MNTISYMQGIVGRERRFYIFFMVCFKMSCEAVKWLVFGCFPTLLSLALHTCIRNFYAYADVWIKKYADNYRFLLAIPIFESKSMVALLITYEVIRIKSAKVFSARSRNILNGNTKFHAFTIRMKSVLTRLFAERNARLNLFLKQWQSVSRASLTQETDHPRAHHKRRQWVDEHRSK